MDKVFFHIDLDAFFASVEQHDNQSYKGKPVIVGGLPGDRRSVVSTASYEARKFGVHSAMPIAKAYQLCPNGIYIRGNYRHYQEVSEKIMGILSTYSPDMIQISIDEAFLDMTGTKLLFGESYEAACKIKKDILDQTGLTVSVGIANTMYIAKIASGYKKPDGITIIPKGKETEFMLSLPLDKVWGAGTKTQQRLKNAGFVSTKDIFSKSKILLCTIFGENMGNFLYDAVRGNPEMEFGTQPKNHSISSECTYDFDLTDRYAIESALMELCSNVMYRMHKEKVKSRTIALKIRYEDFSTISVQETSDVVISSTDDIFERSKRLFYKKFDGSKGIRLLGIACENLMDKDEQTQKELFDFGQEKKHKVEEAIYSIQEKYPELKIKKARLM